MNSIAGDSGPRIVGCGEGAREEEACDGEGEGARREEEACEGDGDGARREREDELVRRERGDMLVGDDICREREDGLVGECER